MQITRYLINGIGHRNKPIEKNDFYHTLDGLANFHLAPLKVLFDYFQNEKTFRSFTLDHSTNKITETLASPTQKSIQKIVKLIFCTILVIPLTILGIVYKSVALFGDSTINKNYEILFKSYCYQKKIISTRSTPEIILRLEKGTVTPKRLEIPSALIKKNIFPFFSPTDLANLQQVSKILHKELTMTQRSVCSNYQMEIEKSLKGVGFRWSSKIASAKPSPAVVHQNNPDNPDGAGAKANSAVKADSLQSEDGRPQNYKEIISSYHNAIRQRHYDHLQPATLQARYHPDNPTFNALKTIFGSTDNLFRIPIYTTNVARELNPKRIQENCSKYGIPDDCSIFRQRTKINKHFNEIFLMKISYYLPHSESTDLSTGEVINQYLFLEFYRNGGWNIGTIPVGPVSPRLPDTPFRGGFLSPDNCHLLHELVNNKAVDLFEYGDSRLPLPRNINGPFNKPNYIHNPQTNKGDLRILPILLGHRTKEDFLKVLMLPHIHRPDPS